VLIFFYSIYCSPKDLWTLIIYISVPIQIILITYHVYSDNYIGIFSKEIQEIKDKWSWFRKIIIITPIYIYLFLIIFYFDNGFVENIIVYSIILFTILIRFLTYPYTYKQILQILQILLILILVIFYLFSCCNIFFQNIEILEDISYYLLIFLILLSYITYKSKNFGKVLISLAVYIFFSIKLLFFNEHISKKSHIIEAEGLAKQLIDAELHYKESHGKFYINSDFNKTITELEIKFFPDTIFEYNIKAGETTILIIVNEKNKRDYIYLFYPRDNSDKIKGYNRDSWEGYIYKKDYITHSKTDIDLQNDGEIVSRYKNEIIKQELTPLPFNLLELYHKSGD